MVGFFDVQQADFTTLIHELRALPHETPICEFKQNWNDHKSIGQLISAISNAACLEEERFGFVVWGIHDESHAVVGTTFSPGQKAGASNQELELWLSQMVQPAINFKFIVGHVDNQRVVLLRIPAAESIITKFQHIAYIRIGSGTPKLSDYPERKLPSPPF